MRGMALQPVNPPQVNCMGGQEPSEHNEFVISRIANRQGKTSDVRRLDEHRGNNGGQIVGDIRRDTGDAKDNRNDRRGNQ